MFQRETFFNKENVAFSMRGCASLYRLAQCINGLYTIEVVFPFSTEVQVFNTDKIPYAQNSIH
jgi:hypothetical protein